MNPSLSLPIGTYGSWSRLSAIKSRQAGMHLSMKKLLSMARLVNIVLDLVEDPSVRGSSARSTLTSNSCFPHDAKTFLPNTFAFS